MAQMFNDLDKQDELTFPTQLFGVQMCVNGLLHALLSFDLISAETWQQLQAEKDRLTAVAKTEAGV